MKSLKAILLFALLILLCELAIAQPTFRPSWEPRWYVELSGNVLSPGGLDKDRYVTSIGGGLTLIYWLNWDTQLLASATTTSMKTEPYYWLPFDPADTSVALSNIDVEGGVKIFSLEARKMFPADRQNFLYLGLGLDYFYFNKIDAKWLQQNVLNTTAPPIPYQITVKRDPSWAAGAHVSPGLFFLLYPKVSVDIAIRIHALYDGDNTLVWLVPTFGMGLRIF